ncbi:neuroplastin-like [Glandiceps talaboti]
MEDITFTCTLSSGDVNDLKWYLKKSGKSEIELLDGDEMGKYSITYDGALKQSILTVTNLEVDDNGNYKCSEVRGSSHTSTLTVYDIPMATLTMNPDNPNIELGINITINCTSNYEDQVKFTKNGETLEGLERVTIDGNMLSILDSQLTDSGNYECIVNITDLIGLSDRVEVARDNIQINTPVHVNVTDNLRLEEGETARFTCNATSYPFPSIVWYDGNQQLANETFGDKLFVSEVEDKQRSTLVSTLNIRRVTYESHHGQIFFCNATNNGTTDSAQGLLEIKDGLAALWPCLGVLIEMCILLPLIFVAEKYLSS